MIRCWLFGHKFAWPRRGLLGFALGSRVYQPGVMFELTICTRCHGIFGFARELTAAEKKQ